MHSMAGPVLLELTEVTGSSLPSALRAGGSGVGFAALPTESAINLYVASTALASLT